MSSLEALGKYVEEMQQKERTETRLTLTVPITAALRICEHSFISEWWNTDTGLHVIHTPIFYPKEFEVPANDHQHSIQSIEDLEEPYTFHVSYDEMVSLVQQCFDHDHWALRKEYEDYKLVVTGIYEPIIHDVTSWDSEYVLDHYLEPQAERIAELNNQQDN